MNRFTILLAGLGLAGLSLTARALCVNPDGSLDDPSVSPETIATDMLPSCQSATTTGAAAQPTSATSSGIQTIERTNAKAHSTAGQPGTKS